MNWPKEYLREIRRGAIAADKKIIAVYERECGWMDDPPQDPAFHYRFDEDLGQRHIDFMQKFCRQSKGKHGKEPIVFDLFQLAKMQLIFGWVDIETGKRRFREVVDIRGRKCGKSTETAAVQHDMLLNDQENGPEIYDVANTKDQAMLVFTECANMRAQSPALRMIEKKRRSDIYCTMNFGIIKALAANTDNLDGLNASFVCQDEWHEQRDSALYDVMKQSQAEREQPIYWMISTNGKRREGFFDAKYNTASRIALWEDGFHDYRTLSLIYELDSRSEWTDEACWEKANPGLGKIKSIETLREHVEQAKRDPTFLPTVLTKDFNIPENSASNWLTYEEAVNEAVAPMEMLEHSYAIGGCDLSATNDLTCATLLIMKPGDDHYYVLQKYFLPQARIDALDATASDREAPYRLWAERGYLHICAGATVDYNDVTKWFVDMVQIHDIRPLWICYDAALSGYWVPQMAEYGFNMDKIRQGPITWTYPMKLLQGALHEHRVV
ncbi:MAG: terminase large subunit, partial [Lachnospiraceae bacterium]|nr:terminase large subunit [Lachnospiraceae bacterium]